ncbi:MAG: alpha/beta fold hydrolase [Planctomycetota bacterium]
MVHLHGHGSIGDQIFTREDIRASWLTRYRALGLGVLSPNLHGNAWMCPEAVADLHDLLAWVRKEYEVKSFYIVSGSMGGTGNLIYAIIHPEDVTALVALCPVTDIVAYHGWCQAHPGGVRDAIRLAIESAYHGRPDQVPDQYSGHIVTPYADRLTMPLFLAHATGDEVIPVKQSRELQRSLANAPNAVHVELAGGNNDTPLFQSGMLEWLEQQIIRRR